MQFGFRLRDGAVQAFKKPNINSLITNNQRFVQTARYSFCIDPEIVDKLHWTFNAFGIRT